MCELQVVGCRNKNALVLAKVRDLFDEEIPESGCLLGRTLKVDPPETTESYPESDGTISP
jgi:hypothetical protein